MRGMTQTERPIIMSAPMVRAILAGTKTQTRRIAKLTDAGHVKEVNGHRRWHPADPEARLACPYGQPGDVLWVRETWAPDPPIDDSWASTVWAGCGRLVREIPERFHHPRFCNYAADWPHGPIRWTPSIHMPRWARRIDLRVTGVRVERLHEISASDAVAEGLSRMSPIDAYMHLWESLHGPGSWELNQRVWVIEFARIKP